MRVVSFDKAVSYIRDGDTVVIGGSGGGHAIPEALIVALEKRYLSETRPINITLLHPVGVGDNISQGVGHLAHNGLVKRIVTGALVNSPAFQDRAEQDTVEAYTLPQGALSELMREMAAGRPGLFSQVGLHTFVDPRVDGGRQSKCAKENLVELVTLEGKEWIFYKPYKIDIAYLWGTTADEDGWGLQEINAFSDSLALEVVRGDMAADSMNPDGTINLGYIYMNPISPPGYVTMSDSILNSKIIEIKNPHWYTTPEAAEDMQNAENPFDFGIASHEYQDSFSHWQKLGEPDTSIGIWVVAHALNNPYKLIDDTRGVDYFEPGTATEDRRIDSAMMNGYTSLVDSFVRTQINNWSYDGR